MAFRKLQLYNEDFGVRAADQEALIARMIPPLDNAFSHRAICVLLVPLGSFSAGLSGA